jgi:multidrug efflux system membrane fusion protein
MPSYRIFTHLSSLLLLSALTGATACSQGTAAAQSAPPAPDVAVAHVLSKQASDFDDFSGRIEATNRVELHPRVGGYVNAVHFKEGARVKKGDLLFEIDPRQFAYQANRLEADRRRAQSQLDLAKVDRERGETLFKSGSTTKAEIDRLTAGEEESAASVDSIRASLALARLDLDYTMVRAPIDGRVSNAMVTPGNLVTTASVLTTEVSDGAVYVYFDVDEATLLRITRVQKDGKADKDAKVVRMGLIDEDGYPHEGALDFVDNQLDPRTGTVRARAVIDNPDGRLVPGLFARVRLTGGGVSNALLVDDKAVLTDQDRKYVYVVDEQNRAERKNIVIGRIVDGLRVVESGVDTSDRVVVYGLQKIFFPGAPVKPAEIAMGDPPPAPPAGPGAH